MKRFYENFFPLTVSKPLPGTLLSFALFVVISFVLIGMSLVALIGDKHPAWYVYLVLIVLVPLSIFIVYRIFYNYKVIELGNNQITIRYPVKRNSKHYPLSEVIQWKESVVKTGKNSTFKELEIRFADQFRLTMGLREYSNYSKVYTYLIKKLGKKKQEG